MWTSRGSHVRVSATYIALRLMRVVSCIVYGSVSVAPCTLCAVIAYAGLKSWIKRAISIICSTPVELDMIIIF